MNKNTLKTEDVKFSETETGKNVATQTMVIEDENFKFTAFNDDVIEMVRHAKSKGSDPSYYISDAVQLFNLAVKGIDLPEFSFEEKILIGNCICGSFINDHFINHLEDNVCDLIADGYQYFEDEETGYTDSRKNLIGKIHGLNYMQRIKLVYMVKMG